MGQCTAGGAMLLFGTPRHAMIFIAVSLILTGAFLAYLCRNELILQWGCGRWPQTTGQISGSVVEEGIFQGLATDGTFAPVDRSFREIQWVFTYSVDGCTYQSSRFSFDATGWQANTRNFEEGDQVTVYYCPTDPAIAVLQSGMNPGLLTGPILVVVGLGFLGYWLCSR